MISYELVTHRFSHRQLEQLGYQFCFAVAGRNPYPQGVFVGRRVARLSLVTLDLLHQDIVLASAYQRLAKDLLGRVLSYHHDLLAVVLPIG